ncbi:SURF1 family protein [Nocardioides fonticola]|uniref:SURF1-like protein n=1 Tax=Nocardioides fonticola TaxID=450363 RepID=A0ABP7XR60_9ACTN
MTHPLALRMWPAHLAGLAAVATAVGLGVWQYDAWQARRDAAAVDITREEPVPLTSVMGSDDPFPGADVGRPVEVVGTWIGSGTVYVSDRERDGVTGYWVVTPVSVGTADAPAIPVVRGWVDRPDDAPAPPSGDVVLDGWLQPPEGTGVMDTDRDDDIVPQVRMADLIQHVDRDLYGAYLVTKEPTSGLEQVTLSQLPQVDQFTGLRNILYALEWWVFACFAAYMWWRHVRDETREPDGIEDAAAGAGPEPAAEPAAEPLTDGSVPSNP